tara:strand:- start:227 stop:691 length:465 start_codon:yes stop_codon:yes gene_type:complete
MTTKIDVFIQNKNWKKYIRNPKRHLEKNFRYAQANIKEIENRNINLTILLAGNKEIKILNKKFRKKNKSTDILSFPFYNLKDLKKTPNKKKIYLGDIILNINKIKKKNFIQEFNKLWIHGLLHLVGHKHYRDRDFYKMNSLENKIYELITKKND